MSIPCILYVPYYLFHNTLYKQDKKIRHGDCVVCVYIQILPLYISVTAFLSVHVRYTVLTSNVRDIQCTCNYDCIEGKRRTQLFWLDFGLEHQSRTC